MSIDLHVRFTRPLSLRPVLPEVARVFAEMLGTAPAPELVLEVLEEGQRRHAERDELRDKSSHFFLISISGEPETVGVMAGRTYAVVTMAAQRTNLEYALGAAIAIVLGREMGSNIEDDRQFFGEPQCKSPEALFNTLRVFGSGSNYREAAEQLTGRIDLTL